MQKLNSKFVFGAAALLAAGLVSCGGSDPESDGNSGSTSESASADGAITELALSSNIALNGAGASFPAPLYQRWFQEFSNAQSELQVNYQSVGSGAGVEQFTQGTVDFGASDVAMTDEEMAAIERGTILLPMTAGSVVLAYNVPGVESGLNLSRDNYTGILLGEITKWNDPAIAADNPDVELPDQQITVVYRSDGSGTTGVFTKHLSAISSDWSEKIGEGKSVDWPTGVGAKGNEGVTAQITQTPGAIGYIEYAYAKLNEVPFAALENQEGNFILPSDESASLTLAAVELPDNLRAFITDPEGADSYPIVTYTWMLVYGSYEDPDTAKSIEATIEFGLNQGQDIAPELGYIPLPQNVRERVAAAADVLSPDYEIVVK
ncbi:phosphate ABC transporter, phosphate-binding protein [Rubidibacter lacunae KORDI 51-2]|uniref:Phosphate-binding protein n=1 Tax=Rubidibacter lacunae KORDI 51-2 TaxID=582515 RepID=U5DKG9_9CHRO|nr:phosphate ABC transporter substrate-binding protein PstS [Rubidibacter lacunae]ERN41064.1 phosphate ABC transporter, phosphate-binding protein [Rubidibacter lacunae KORDI 51-2]